MALVIATVLMLAIIAPTIAATAKTDNTKKINTITGTFKPSGVYGRNYAYKWYKKTWVNYCPGCKRHNTLRLNPKGVPEREITCSRCSADFDGVTGWDKMYKPRWKLHTLSSAGVVSTAKKPNLALVMAKNITTATDTGLRNTDTTTITTPVVTGAINS